MWLAYITSNPNSSYREDKGVGLGLGRILRIQSLVYRKRYDFNSPDVYLPDGITKQQIVLPKISQPTTIDKITKVDKQPRVNLNDIVTGKVIKDNNVK